MCWASNEGLITSIFEHTTNSNSRCINQIYQSSSNIQNLVASIKFTYSNSRCINQIYQSSLNIQALDASIKFINQV